MGVKKPNNKNQVSVHDDSEMFAVYVHPRVAEIIRAVNGIGLFGQTYPETLDRIVCGWILDNADRLRALGVEVPL